MWDPEEQQVEVKKGTQAQCKQDQHFSLAKWIEPFQVEHPGERFAQIF